MLGDVSSRPMSVSAHWPVLQRNPPEFPMLALKVVFAAVLVLWFLFSVDLAVRSQCCRNTAGFFSSLQPSCLWQLQLGKAGAELGPPVCGSLSFVFW